MKRGYGVLMAGIISLVAARAYAQQNSQSPSFGTTNTTYVSVGAPEFNPSVDSTSYQRTESLFPFFGGADFFAVPHLPGGAFLTSLELDYCDSDVSGNHVHLDLIDCVLNTPLIPCTLTTLGSVTSSSNGCSFLSADLSSMNYTVDNKSRRLNLRVIFDAPSGTNILVAAVVGYKLQVSPAPVTATFTDVPTSDFGFQFIEAFNAAGITVGCNASPPQFCPDRNVTRREMAVFFAKALGLQFQ